MKMIIKSNLIQYFIKALQLIAENKNEVMKVYRKEGGDIVIRAYYGKNHIYDPENDLQLLKLLSNDFVYLLNNNFDTETSIKDWINTLTHYPVLPSIQDVLTERSINL